MDIVDRVREAVSDKKFQDEIADFLIKICEIDTTPNADVSIMRDNERKVFTLIEERLQGLSFGNSQLVRKEIPAEIDKHPSFTPLHFTRTENVPEGLSIQEAYRDRYSLLYLIDNEVCTEGNNTAVNAHIDTVAPFSAPERRGGRVYGRGTADDKGNIAVICGALSIIDGMAKRELVDLKNKITAMFVIEEETGGNGSLAIAMDKNLRKRYDSIVVLEAAGNKIHPANRGAVWFKCEISWNHECNPGVSEKRPPLLESMIFPVLEVQIEGEKIKAESDHSLFPDKPVQTCNGILGPFGEHPSTIAGILSFVVRGIRNDDELSAIKDAADKGLREYIAQNGDKTQVRVDIIRQNGGVALMTVHGASGHMGSILEKDDAITEWAHIAKNILELKLSRNMPIEMELEGFDSAGGLTLEGGQGFLPTHKLEDIKQRIAKAFARGVRKYIDTLGLKEDSISHSVTFDKLHNDAFAGDPDSPSMKRAWQAGIDAGTIDKDTPVLGWKVSCDARLFAAEYPGMPVITAGAGELKAAHSEDESICLPDLFKAIAFTALFLLRETGSVKT